MAGKKLVDPGEAQALAYPARLLEEPEGVTITFRDVPEAITGTPDRDEALALAVDCLESALNFHIGDHAPLPTPSRPRRGEVMIALSALGCAKMALYLAMRADGVSKAELARRLGTDNTGVGRLLNLAHGSRIEQLEAALAALGRRLSVTVERAA